MLTSTLNLCIATYAARRCLYIIMVMLSMLAFVRRAAKFAANCLRELAPNMQQTEALQTADSQARMLPLPYPPNP